MSAENTVESDAVACIILSHACVGSADFCMV